MKRFAPLALVLYGCSSAPGDGPMIHQAPLAAGVRISKVVAYQGLQATIMKDGQPTASEVPLVIGRPAFVRIFLEPQADWQPREVVVRFESSARGAARDPVETRRTITAASADSQLDSTVNIDLAGDDVTGDLTWGVSVREIEPGAQADGAAGAIYPADGLAPFGAQDTGDGVSVVLIPIRYDADGSGRLPDTGSTQIARLKSRMMALYPVRAVDISVGPPLPWSQVVSPSGTGWGSLLQAVVSTRLRDGVPRNVYYYGIFTPAPTLDQFCGGGCVAGLSPISFDPNDDYARGSIGLGYSGKYSDADGTFVHEVGHAHGRQHAPCQVNDADPDYPYVDGQIGVWGWDRVTMQLLSPQGRSRDMMGYCDPIWISDYTYNALFDRISYLNGSAQRIGAPSTAIRWRSIVVDKDGAARGDIVTAPAQAQSQTKTIERVTASGVESVTVRYYPFDHLPGGLALVPEDADTGTLRIDGVTVQ